MTWLDALVLAGLFGAGTGLYTWIVVLNPHRAANARSHEEDT
jgi:hypothetical protein